MSFNHGDKPAEIAAILRDAGSHGLDVRMYVDWWTVLADEADLPRWAHTTMDERRRYYETTRMLQSLPQEGVASRLTNPPGFVGMLFPWMGRNHVKVFLVDNTAYILSLNLDSKGFGRIEYAVKTTDPGIVDGVAHYFDLLEHGGVGSDSIIPCGADSRLLLDCGARGQSVTLGEVVRAGANKDITLVTDHVPGGPLLRTILANAKAGFTSTIVLKPADHRFIDQHPFKWTYGRFRGLVDREMNIRIVHPATDHHGKVLIMSGPRGDEIVYLGSHNFKLPLVLAGTAEMTLATRRPDLVRPAREFADHLVRSG